MEMLLQLGITVKSVAESVSQAAVWPWQEERKRKTKVGRLYAIGGKRAGITFPFDLLTYSFTG